MFRIALVLTLSALTPAASAQDTAPSQVPNVATEIVIEDLAISVKRLRLGVALSPEQIEGLTKALQSAGATVTTKGGGGLGNGSPGAAQGVTADTDGTSDGGAGN